MSHDENRRTVAAYERCARDYAATVPQQPAPFDAQALRSLVAAMPPDSTLLEVGSGPGWEADFVESLGVPVHRTDVTAAFREFQAERGKRVDALDLLADDIAGCYGGVLMLCVLQHFEREQVDAALRKLRSVLLDDGALLLSCPLGDDDFWQHGDSGDYRVVRWSMAALDQRLQQAGFAIAWSGSRDFEEGPWRTVLARAEGSGG